MRFFAVVAILLAGRPAAADLDVCKAERLEAEQVPSSAEDVRAFERCTDKWREILPRARDELSKTAPLHRPGCERQFADWEATTHADPTSYDAMVARLAAREQVDRCNADALLADPSSDVAQERHRSEIAHEHRSARGMIIVGSVLLGVGGIGLTAAGAVGLATLNRTPTNPTEGNTFYFLGLGVAGVLSGVMAATGALILGFGARQYHATQTAM